MSRFVCSGLLFSERNFNLEGQDFFWRQDAIRGPLSPSLYFTPQSERPLYMTWVTVLFTVPRFDSHRHATRFTSDRLSLDESAENHELEAQPLLEKTSRAKYQVAHVELASESVVMRCTPDHSVLASPCPSLSIRTASSR